jgi:quercetin dioxygenase-like cupin family protein
MRKSFTIAELPVYNDSYVGEKEVISRKIGSKGELATLAVTEMNYIALVSFHMGKGPRGNHYHQKKVEYLYICKGKVRVYLKNINDLNAKVETHEVEEGGLVYIEPGISHAVEAIEDSIGIEFSPTKFKLVKDDNFKDVLC